jgi:hypothetical protein
VDGGVTPLAKGGPPCVVLLDEIDKGERGVPNALLEALSIWGFKGPDGTRVDCDSPHPLVIITTNEERDLPDAFLRRCLVLTLELPDERGPAEGEGRPPVETTDRLCQYLVRRSLLRFPALAPEVHLHAAKALAADRRDRQLGYLPGLAEYMDLLSALSKEDPDDPLTLFPEVRPLFFRKVPNRGRR